MDRVFEFRKIVIVGYKANERTPGARLDVVFWIPQAKPQRCAGVTKVADVLPFERQALCAGVISEILIDYRVTQEPTIESLRKELMPLWERMTLSALGYVPNSAPLDDSTRPLIQFTAV